MKKWVFLTVALYSFNLKAQECTIKASPFIEFASLSELESGNPSTEELLCVNVKFHFIRDNNGFGNVSNGDISQIIGAMNSLYNTYQISFSSVGSDITKNSSLYYRTTLSVDDVALIKSLGYDPNALNVYTLPSLISPLSEKVLSNCIFINEEHVFSNLLAHETGHCLNLYHTHHGTSGESTNDPGACIELPDGSNGKICGDYIWTTPADPGLKNKTTGEYFVDENCYYIESNEYNPDTRNIMSYSRINCMDHFTNEQAIRMRRAIVNSPVLIPLINCSGTTYPLLIGDNTISSTQTVTYILPCGTSSGYTCSSNLLIISSTNQSVTIKPKNSSVNGQGWVKINGNNYQKNIWIGKPKIKITQTLDGEFVNLSIAGNQYSVDAQNIEAIKWITVSKSGNCSLENAVNHFKTIATGSPGTQWNINARIEVSNDAGTSYMYTYTAPPAPNPCETGYLIVKSGPDEYMVEIVDPCNEMLKSQSEGLTNEIKVIQAQVIDLSGYEKRSYKNNRFNVSGLKKGIYILRVVLSNTIISYKLNIE